MNRDVEVSPFVLGTENPNTNEITPAEDIEIRDEPLYSFRQQADSQRPVIGSSPFSDNNQQSNLRFERNMQNQENNQGTQGGQLRLHGGNNRANNERRGRQQPPRLELRTGRRSNNNSSYLEK